MIVVVLMIVVMIVVELMIDNSQVHLEPSPSYPLYDLGGCDNRDGVDGHGCVDDRGGGVDDR